jgi:hypothetical protein
MSGKLEMIQPGARLTIHGQGDVRVDVIGAFLEDLDDAYNSIAVFEVVLERLFQTDKPTTDDLDRRLSRLLDAHQAGHLYGRPLTPNAIARLVPVWERLILKAVMLESPGFWEFAGSLNPLEVLRKYLNDRHERRKDAQYRENAEKRRLDLENLARENKVIADRIQIARELGAQNEELAQLLRTFIVRPLTRLDRYGDRDIVGRAELSE